MKAREVVGLALLVVAFGFCLGFGRAAGHYLMDVWLGDEDPVFYGAEVYEFVAVDMQPGRSERACRYTGRGDDGATRILYIDGDRYGYCPTMLVRDPDGRGVHVPRGGS